MSFEAIGESAGPSRQDEIEELYHSRGYNSATVTLLEGNKPEDRRAIFLINEGVK